MVTGAREAVGVFHEAGRFEAAVAELLGSGFDRADLSVLASENTVEAKLGHRYDRVEELEDDPLVPRVAFRSTKSVHEAESAVVGGLVYAGSLAGAVAVVASAGPIGSSLLAALQGGAGGGVFGTALAEWIERRSAARLADQLEKGGILLWVRTADEAQEERAQAIMRRHGATDVHVHDVAGTAHPERSEALRDFLEAQLDPGRVFASPDEVLARADFTPAQKEAVLRRWAYDAERLSESESEGMGGGEPSRLGRVLEALEQLRSERARDA